MAAKLNIACQTQSPSNQLGSMGFVFGRHTLLTNLYDPSTLNHLSGCSERYRSAKKASKTSFPDDAEWQRTLRCLLSLEQVATKNLLQEIFYGWYDEVFRDLGGTDPGGHSVDSHQRSCSSSYRCCQFSFHGEYGCLITPYAGRAERRRRS